MPAIDGPSRRSTATWTSPDPILREHADWAAARLGLDSRLDTRLDTRIDSAIEVLTA